MNQSLVVDNTLTIRAFTSSDITRVVTLYQACFAEPPWFETFDPEELTREFSDMLSWTDAVFLVTEACGEVVGGIIGFDLDRKADITALLPPLVDKRFYLSELFVLTSMRNRQVAQKLIRRCFEQIRDRGYNEVVVRTSINQPIIRSIFERMGFKIVATQEVESIKFINGVRCALPDRRIILAGQIP